MEHTFLKSPKHDCGRCGCTTPLSELTWQGGILVCKRNDCRDTEVVGARDIRVSNIVESLTVSRELQPDDKLVRPQPASDDLYFEI